MFLDHLKTFLWLRRRMFVNQFRRSGNAAKAVTVVALSTEVVLIFVAFLVPFVAAVTDFFGTGFGTLLPVWLVGTTLGLQAYFLDQTSRLVSGQSFDRSKLRHLPISSKSFLAIDFLSGTFDSMTLALLAAASGLALGSALRYGPCSLLAIPHSFLLMVFLSSVLFRVRNWFTAGLQDRRRIASRVIAMLAFVGLFLLTSLRPATDSINKPGQQQPRLDTKNLRERTKQSYAPWVRLAASAEESALGNPLPAFFDMLLLGLGSAALLYWENWVDRANFATHGDAMFSRRRSRRREGIVMELQIPFLSEETNVIALATFKSVTRMPLFLLIMICSMLYSGGFLYVTLYGNPLLKHSEHFAIAIYILLFPLATLYCAALVTPFHIVRGGLRVFMLSGVPRSKVLFGTMLAPTVIFVTLASFQLTMGTVLARLPWELVLSLLFAIFASIFFGASAFHFVAIYFPLPTRRVPGGKIPQILSQLATQGATLVVVFMAGSFALPIYLCQDLLALGAPVGVTVCLEAVLCIGSIVLYRTLLPWQGRLLQRREEKIYRVISAQE